MLNDTLANALSAVLNSEKIGKEFCIVGPVSRIVKEVLDIMNSAGYIGSYETQKVHGGSQAKVFLIGMINKCGAVKPRNSIKLENLELAEKRFLPAKDFGILILSTNEGIMTNETAKKKKVGGRLIAYCY
jgi:small subunit ribosomal protein S8